MFDRFLSLLETHPKHTALAGLILGAAVTGCSSLAFYSLSTSVEIERTVAMRSAESAREEYHTKTKIANERAKLNADNIRRIVDSALPVLKAQVDELTTLRNELKARDSDPVTSVLFQKLAMMEFQTAALHRQLATERLITSDIYGIPTVAAAQVPSSPTLDRATWIAAAAAILLTAFAAAIAFAMKRPNPENSAAP